MYSHLTVFNKKGQTTKLCETYNPCEKVIMYKSFHFQPHLLMYLLRVVLNLLPAALQ